jgi:hypothetical protein
VIARGSEGEWDDVALLQGHAFVNEGGRTMLWYSHWNPNGTGTEKMEIGLATLRRDGFGHLSCKQDDNDAEFITAPFTLGTGAKMGINVEGITPGAPLTVELLDSRDRAVPGCAATIASDGTHQPIAWPGDASLPEGRQVALRVKFPAKSNARVFAIYVSE